MAADPAPVELPVLGPLASAVRCLDAALDDAALDDAGSSDGYGQDMTRLADAELAQVLALLDAARRDLDRLLLAVVAENDQRGPSARPASAGSADGTGLSVFDWVSRHCPYLSTGEVHHAITVAAATRELRHAPLAAAVAEGSLPLRRAAALTHALARISPFVDADDYTDYQRIVLPLAATGTDRELRTALTHLVGVVAPDADTETLAERRRRCRDLSERAAPGGMAEFVLRLDPEGAASVRAVTTSLAAAPCPDDRGPDPRSPGHRRADALLTVLRRGMAAGDHVHTNGSTTMLVSVDHETLADALAVHDSRVVHHPGRFGTTATGEHLTPGVLRRLACEADLIPAVLGGPSQPLDLGRATRLATRAQHLALGIRDKGCTIPGCSMPPQYCIAHHTTWWSRGGNTDLGNLTLLCTRHHTDVHARDLRATIDPSGVTWHL